MDDELEKGQTMGLEDMQQNQVQAPAREEPFYRRTWFCVLMAIIFPPLGIALIWVFKKPTAQSARIALTVVSAVILVGAIGDMGNAAQSIQSSNNEQSAVEESSTMQKTDAPNADETVTTNFMGGELFGATVEKAWETVEAKGYAVAFKSPTGADLNPGRNSMHSSTMKTWRIKSARLDESSNTVTLWVTSEDGFIEEYGKKAMKD